MVAPTVILSTQEQSNTGIPPRRPSGYLDNVVPGLVKKLDHGERSDVKPQKWACLNTVLKRGDMSEGEYV